jgi:hypothetical protein
MSPSTGRSVVIQGTLRPILGKVLGNLDVSWLAGLTPKGATFEGRPRGDGEWLLVWYLHGDNVWAGVVPRGSTGRLFLIHQLFRPASPPGAFVRVAGPLLVAVLVAAAVTVAMGLLEYAARTRRPSAGPLS